MINDSATLIVHATPEDSIPAVNEGQLTRRCTRVRSSFGFSTLPPAV